MSGRQPPEVSGAAVAARRPPEAPLPPELAALDDRFVIATQEVALPDGPVRLEHPRSAEDLISQDDFDRDERLPYWADLWPSAIALAQALGQLSTGAAHTLELGCGLGLVTVSALRAGHDVLATDYYADALLFTRRNALRATGREPRVQLVDWRSLPGTLGRFDLVLASDVLYERAYAQLVCSVIARTLTPAGVALVADPGRAAVGTFVAECGSAGLSVAERLRIPFHAGTVEQVITILELRNRTS